MSNYKRRMARGVEKRNRMKEEIEGRRRTGRLMQEKHNENAMHIIK